MPKNIFSEPKEAVLGLDKMYQEAIQQQSKSKPDA